MAKTPVRDSFLEGNDIIEKAIDDLSKERTKKNLFIVLNAIRFRMHADGHLIFPVFMDKEDGH